MHDESDSSSDIGPALPAGVLRSRGGWAGDSLEIEHQRENLRAANEDGERNTSHAAVDLSQFRNEEVGKGYQAKGVIRQKGAVSSSSKVVDMTGGKDRKEKAHKHGSEGDRSLSKKRRLDSKDESDDRKKTQEETRLDSYLKSNGMRLFMGEIETILTEEEAKR